MTPADVTIPQSPPLWATFYFAHPGGNHDGRERCLIIAWQYVGEDDDYEDVPHGWYPVIVQPPSDKARAVMAAFSQGRMPEGAEDVYLEVWPATCTRVPYVINDPREA